MIVSTTYKIKINTAFIALVVGCSMFFSCGRPSEQTKKSESDTEINQLVRIHENGVLRAVVDYNSTNYFVYRGRPMGFKYEMLKDLSNELDVRLEITVINDPIESFKGLKEDRFDVVARNLTVTMERKKSVDFTVPIMETNQVLVQREIDANTPDSLYIYSVLELAGKKVHVVKNSAFHKRLLHLSEEIGGEIEVVLDSVNGTEQLIALVANGEIDYALCDNNVGLLNKTYYPNIDVSLDISFSQNIAWAIPKDDENWGNYLNDWITKFKKTRKFAVLYDRYFESPRIVNRLNSGWHSISGGKISAYDPVIKKLAGENGWDWRLVAAIIAQESRFNPDVESWAGAYGLMQLVPETAEALGIEDYKDPAENIRGGIYMLNWLSDRLAESVPDSTERIKFILASYNVGLGHVLDAQRLAEKYGKNSRVWDDNVDFFLKNKSSEKYFKDPVVRWGYCRGDQPYNYVHKVTANYMHYLNVIPES